MSNNDNFSVMEHLPILPAVYTKEAFSGEFVYTQSPFVYTTPASLFTKTQFYKTLENQFGLIKCKYLKNPPNSLYDWHCDRSRHCALNWIVKTTPDARTFYRSENKHKFFWDLDQVDYRESYPTLLNTKNEHCVYNNSTEERIILSLSICDYPYHQVREFLKLLDITAY